MQVKHILREKGRQVVTIAGDATLSEAATLLARKRIGALVVRAVAEASVAALAQSVSLHMSRALTTCSEADTIDDLMEVMTRRRFRHVPVLDDGDRLAGIVSIGDVVKSRIEETVREAATLREYIAAG